MASMEWEYLVLRIRIKKTNPRWEFEALAWVDQEQVYSEELSDMYWSKPLAALGRDGWELVSAIPENALMGSWIEDWSADTSRPVQTNFFFKRPKGMIG